MNKKLLILHTKILFFIFFIFSYSVSLGQTTLFQYDFERSTDPNINNTVGIPSLYQSGGLSNLAYNTNNPCGGYYMLSSSSWNNDDYYLITVNTTGFYNLIFSYCNRTDNSKIGKFISYFSVDGGATKNEIISEYTPTTSNVTKTSITLPNSANNNGEVYLYIQKTNNSDNNSRIFYVDDIKLTGYVLPKITSFTPTNVCEGAGAKVIITGVNFTGATAVKFNGVAASSFSVDNSTQITAQLPATATTGAITVTTPSGVITSGTSFVVNPLPVITSLTNSSPSICIDSGGSSTLTASSSSSSPAPVTIVNYDFNSGTSYANLTPVLASGITSVISTSSSGDFSTGFRLASNGTNTTNAFTPNTNSTNSLHGETHKRTWIFTISGTNLALYKTFKLYFQYKMISTDGKQKLNISFSKNGSSTDSTLDTYVILASGNWYESILDLTTVADNATSLTITITSEQGGPSAQTFIDNFQIQAIPSNLSYSWTASPSATAGLPSGAETASVSNSSIVVKPTATTAYTVTTKSFGNCIASKTTTVTVKTLTAPTAGATTQPDCITATGSVSLSGLPTGSWTLNRRIKGETVSVPISANTTEYEDKGLAVGIYFYTVTQGSCISLESQQVSINNAPTPVTNTWNGTSWSLNTPTSLQSLIFDSPSTTPSTTTFTTPFLTDISGCSCLVKSGANIIFSAGKTLKILNEVAVEENGILTFENNASLVQTNDAAVNTGNISYNRMTSAVRSSDFTYWSSPVLGQTFLKAFPAAGSGRLYSFGAAVNNWEGKSASSAMLVGTGYIVQVPVGSASVPYVATFIGVPNNGLIDKTPIGPTNSFNLIGNPYPSALDADAFLDKNAAILNGTIYFWTHNTAIQLASGITNGSAGSGAYAYTSDDYATYNGVGGLATTAESKASIKSGTGNRNIPTGRIAAGQAFFVSSKKTGTIIFNNAMRLGADKAKLDNSQFFKINTISKLAQTIEKNRIWLNLTNSQGAFKQTLVGYVTGATNEYDSRFDGESFNANAYVNFYSINLNRNWSIQGRALPFDPSDQVPLGYSSNVAGGFTINIAQLDGFLTAQSVFLEDKLTNTVFDLKSGDYTFTTAIGVFNDRFVLRYTNKTLGTEDFKSLENEVLVSNTDRLIQINSTIETLGKVVIYDIAGKQLYMKTNLDAKELQIANLAASHQVLLVNISLQNGQVFTKKIIF